MGGSLRVLLIAKPFCDAFVYCPRRYAEFIDLLVSKGMLSFKKLRKSNVGIFFVKKKNGKLS